MTHPLTINMEITAYVCFIITVILYLLGDRVSYKVSRFIFLTGCALFATAPVLEIFLIILL